MFSKETRSVQQRLHDTSEMHTASNVNSQKSGWSGSIVDDITKVEELGRRKDGINRFEIVPKCSNEDLEVIFLPSKDFLQPWDWTSGQGVKQQVATHFTGQLGGVVPELWLAENSFHICPVCSRLISTRT